MDEQTKREPSGSDPILKSDSREAYSTPKLTTYGSIEDLTKKVGAHGNTDGGSFPTIRTHV